MPTMRAQRKTARRPTMPKRPTQPRGGEEALYTLTAATPHRAAPPKKAEHWIGREAQSRYARNQTKRLQCNLHPQGLAAYFVQQTAHRLSDTPS